MGGVQRVGLAQVALALVAPVAATAADTQPSGYIAAGLFYASPDSARGADSGAGVSYGYGRGLGARAAWELRLFADTLETGVAGGTDFYQYGAGLDLVGHLGDAAGGHPYGLVGVGAVGNDVDPDAKDAVSGYANVALGWRSAPWSGWGLRHRLELRGVYDSFESGQIDVLAGLTLEIGAGRTRVVETVVEKVVERVVEKEVIREVPALAAAAVEVDRDGDGVADDADRCPDTVAGAVVDPDGCVRRAQVVVLPNIEFEFARAELTAAGREELQKVVRFLHDQQDIRLDVWGHTDDKGTEIYNLGLSQRRAAAVVAFLVSGGTDKDRLDSAGFGESRPLADNGTEEGQARNRRVELNIRMAANVAGSR